MTQRSENIKAIEELFLRLENEFGLMAPQIVDILVEALGGLRVTFPDIKFVHRKERNRDIRKKFDGKNYRELGERFGLKERSIRNILASTK